MATHKTEHCAKGSKLFIALFQEFSVPNVPDEALIDRGSRRANISGRLVELGPEIGRADRSGVITA
jgi:hypothetical protein